MMLEMSILIFFASDITKMSGNWVRLNTAMALGIVWRDRIQTRKNKNVATKSNVI